MNRRTFTQVLAATALGAATATQSKAARKFGGIALPHAVAHTLSSFGDALDRVHGSAL